MDGENWPLSDDKQYFHCILSKSHVLKNYLMVLPVKISRVLPQAVVPVVLTCRNKIWKMNYLGEGSSHKRFDSGWKNFVVDNKLKVGDGCVFELTECTTDCIKFRVQFLDGELPPNFADRVDVGENAHLRFHEATSAQFLNRFMIIWFKVLAIKQDKVLMSF